MSMDISTKKIRERAILVSVADEKGLHHGRDSERLEELRLLADTAGADVAGIVIQKKPVIAPTYYIGKGKADELKEEVLEKEADIVMFDNDLSPAQLSNLEKLLDIKVIDRSGLILDIFALRARTREAKTQVELAQLKYLLPRLTRQWTHLSRQQGGIGMRGPGETQLEVDRRRIRQRISHLNDILKKIERRREMSRKQRSSCFRVALVGYTNAGKSTLLNALSGANVAVENKLFKTLDSVTRLVRYESAPDILLSDTVGFIRDLPHDLVASFKSTLDEVREADFLLHVVDITNPEWEEQVDVVNDVLADLGVSETVTVMVFNKTDRLEDDAMIAGLNQRYRRPVFVSGAEGAGLDHLKRVLVDNSLSGWVRMTRSFSPAEGRMLGDVYRHGIVSDTTSLGDSIELTFTIRRAAAEKIGLFDAGDIPNTA